MLANNERIRDRLRKLDVSSMMVFLAVMRSHKTTAAAKELGLSQSSVSHSLSKLQMVIGDPLFLRRSHGLEPTAKARAIEGDITAALAALEACLIGKPGFDPELVQRLRVGGTGIAFAAILPSLSEAIRSEAGEMQLIAHQTAASETGQKLEDGIIDLALAEQGALRGARLIEEPLPPFQYVVVAREAHRIFQSPLTLGRYCDMDHLVVSSSNNDADPVDGMLSARDMKRRIAISVSELTSACQILNSSDLVATLPLPAIRGIAKRFGLAQGQPPFKIEPLKLAVFRHIRDRADPRLEWAAARIISALR